MREVKLVTFTTLNTIWGALAGGSLPLWISGLKRVITRSAVDLRDRGSPTKFDGSLTIHRSGKYYHIN